MNQHYTDSKIQPIQAIEHWCTGTQYVGFCVGNILKYIARYDRKGTPLQDIAKAATYADYVLTYYINTMDQERQASILTKYNLEYESRKLRKLSYECAVGYLRGSIIEKSQNMLQIAQRIHDYPIDSYAQIEAVATAEELGYYSSVLYNVVYENISETENDR
jgi:hypothetical protein